MSARLKRARERVTRAAEILHRAADLLSDTGDQTNARRLRDAAMTAATAIVDAESRAQQEGER